MRSSCLPALLLLSTVALSAGCSTGPQVQAERSPDGDFAHYATYEWAEQTSPADTVALPHADIFDATVRHDVEQELAAKGLHKATDTFPDLIVSYSAVSDADLTYGQEPTPTSWGRFEEAFLAPRGSFTLTIVDAKTKHTIWQGMVTRAFGAASAGGQELTAAIKELLKSYPSA